MTIFTIGFTKKNAKQFFELLKANQIDLLVDIRLNNKSQLAGFTKGDDLPYFLSEICHCAYRHCEEFAPTKEILDGYKKKQITWEGYVEGYTELMEKRGRHRDFAKRFSAYQNVCLLCSEPTPEKCHRRLLAEMIVGAAPEKITVRHI
ncbi:MAG: DUF488 domain-containing protein [Oscillibacter sp.]|nr:DUF488 domain-containing protein [Oscillibacter sp.]